MKWWLISNRFPGFVWSGGSTTTKDLCSSCAHGFYPNSNQNKWKTTWGDGIVAGDEEWDDNNTQDSDGWSSKWTIENKNSANKKVY